MSKLIILLCSALSAFASETPKELTLTEEDTYVKLTTTLPPTTEEKSKEASSLASDILGETPAAPSLIPISHKKPFGSSMLSDMPQFSLKPPPLRRQARELSPGDIDYILNNHTLEWRLITMVRYVGTNGITEEKIINLIKANPGNSNPYSDFHKAHIIALACRSGLKNIVSAIVENNPDALNCNNSGYSPLDEAIDHDQMDIAKFLRKKGAIRTRVNANDCLLIFTHFLKEKDPIGSRFDVVEALLGLAQVLLAKKETWTPYHVIESMLSEDDCEKAAQATDK
jgi:hypothetical protein